MAIALPAYKSNLLGLIQSACGELGLTVPTTIVGNGDTTATLMSYLISRVGNEVYRAANKNGGWQILRQLSQFSIASSGNITGTFTPGSAVITAVSNTANVVAGMQVNSYGNVIYPTTVVSKTVNTITMSAAVPSTVTANTITFYCGQDNYALPPDFAFFITQTFWDGNFRWQLLGPLEAQEWMVLKYGISPTGPRRRFRIIDNAFYVDPVPNDNGSLLAYEYYSAYWVQSVLGVTQADFLLDTDQSLLDDDVIIMGLKWRYKQRAGLDYTQEKDDYDKLLGSVMARDGGMRDLPLNASGGGIRLLNNTNVPDTGFGT